MINFHGILVHIPGILFPLPDSPSALPNLNIVCVCVCVREREREGGGTHGCLLLFTKQSFCILACHFPWMCISWICMPLACQQSISSVCCLYAQFIAFGNKLITNSFHFNCHGIWILFIFFSNASILMFVLFCQCLKFKTDQAQDVKKMEKLNNLFFTLMSRGPDGTIYLWISLFPNCTVFCTYFSLKCSYFVKFDRNRWILMCPSCSNKFLLVSCVSYLDAADVSEVTGKEQTEARAGKKGRGRKQ